MNLDDERGFEMKVEKPVVEYEVLVSPLHVGASAVVYGLHGHPRGVGVEKTVITSKVEEIVGNGVFETQNTIYRQRTQPQHSDA